MKGNKNEKHSCMFPKPYHMDVMQSAGSYKTGWRSEWDTSDCLSLLIAQNFGVSRLHSE
jgi:hypothetical protein